MRKALGRGLDALLPKDGKEGGAREVESRPDTALRVPISAIKPNRLQPRKNFDPERLAELAQSIKEHGLTQPIAVSYDAITDSFELIAGERRLRAAQLAGLTHIEVVVRTPKNDQERLALALIENIQRDDLNAIETALGYKRLIENFGISQADLSKTLGKSKSAISNTMRLLDLSDEMQKAIQFEQITEGHGRALLMVSDAVVRDKLFRLCLERKLSVRDVEHLAQQAQNGKLPSAKRSKAEAAQPPDLKALEKELEQALGTKVEIRPRKDQKSGRIIIHFYSLDDCDGILMKIKK